MLGQNPRMFQSGLHDPRFYDGHVEAPPRRSTVARGAGQPAQERRVLRGGRHHRPGARPDREAHRVRRGEARPQSRTQPGGGGRTARRSTATPSCPSCATSARATRWRPPPPACAPRCRASTRSTERSWCCSCRTAVAMPIALAGAPMPAPSEVGSAVRSRQARADGRVQQGGSVVDGLRAICDGLAALDPAFTAEHGRRRVHRVGLRADPLGGRGHRRVVGGHQGRRRRPSGCRSDSACSPRSRRSRRCCSGRRRSQHGRREAQRAEIADIIEHERFHVIFEPVVHLPTGVARRLRGAHPVRRRQRPDRPLLGRPRSVGLGLGARGGLCRVRRCARPRSCRRTCGSASTSRRRRSSTGSAAAVRRGRRSAAWSSRSPSTTQIDNYAAVRWAIERLRRRAGRGRRRRRRASPASATSSSCSPTSSSSTSRSCATSTCDPARQALAAGLRHFAALTGTTLVAEGVETQAEAAAIQELGVELAQGYLFDATPAHRVAG